MAALLVVVTVALLLVQKRRRNRANQTTMEGPDDIQVTASSSEPPPNVLVPPDPVKVSSVDHPADSKESKNNDSTTEPSSFSGKHIIRYDVCLGEISQC